jgi:hypothetical protein
MRRGLLLPPLVFSQCEIDALLLGFRSVAKLADPPVMRVASALAKIGAVLPKGTQDSVESSPLFAVPSTRSVLESEVIESAPRGHPRAFRTGRMLGRSGHARKVSERPRRGAQPRVPHCLLALEQCGSSVTSHAVFKP